MSDESQETLIVISKVKKYVKAKAGMNTSDAVAGVISELIRSVCDQAIENAKSGGRKTVMDRDVATIAERLNASAAS